MFMSSSGSFTWRKAWRTVSALSTAVVTDVSPPGEPSDLEYRAPDSAAASRSGHKPGGRAAARRGSQIEAPANAYRETAGAARGAHPPRYILGRRGGRDAWRQRVRGARSRTWLRRLRPETGYSGEHVPRPSAVPGRPLADR